MGGAALAIGGALGCRSLFVSARYNGGGGVNGVAASMNLDASRDAAIRAYSITPDTGAAIPGRLHDQVSERFSSKKALTPFIFPIKKSWKKKTSC